MSHSLNDLPKDVMWLIFRRVILAEAADYGKTVGFNYDFAFGFPFEDMPGCAGDVMRVLSVISRKALALVKTKCYRNQNDLFHFVTGSITFNSTLN